MIIVVEGTKSFDDYDIFMRAMSVALSNIKEDNDIQIWSLGPHKINSFTAAFCNSSETFLKSKGFKISFYKVNSHWVAEHLINTNYYAFFSLPKENISRLAEASKQYKNCELGIYRY